MQNNQVIKQDLISLLNSHLYQLGWQWNHPRIKAYLKIVSERLQILEFQSIDQIPEFYLQKLVQLTELYYNCDRLLRMMDKTWQDEDIQSIVISYGYIDKMPLKGYKRLSEKLSDDWYHIYGF